MKVEKLDELSTDIHGKGRRKKMACSECRQQKQKCDAYIEWPNPCTKCRARNTECRLEPEFKRTSKSKVIKDLEKERDELRKKVAMQHILDQDEGRQRQIASGSLLDLSSNIAFKQTNNFGHASSQLPSPTFKNGGGENNRDSLETSVEPVLKSESDVIPMKCESKTLDAFTLESQHIQNLYQEFVDHYHGFLPIVDISKGPEEIYSLSPPLFWTIMTVAARRYRNGAYLLPLNDILKICLSELALLPVTRFAQPGGTPGFNVSTAYGVQAFLLSTFWPLPSSSLTADSSYNAASIAMTNAIRGGLHCPEHAREFARIKLDNPIFPKISEQIRTWITCNVASQTVAGVFGLPSLTIFDSILLSTIGSDSEIDIPPTIRYMIVIQHLENEIEKSLNSNLKDALGLASLAERLSLIQILSNKLDALELSENEMPDICKMALKIARMHLLTYYFLDNEDLTSLNLQKGLIQAYNAALSVLEFTDTVCRTKDVNFARYLPVVHILSLWQASAIVNKISHSEFQEYVDVRTGKNLYNLTIEHIRSASILKHDVCYRGAEMMKQTWHGFDILVKRSNKPYTAKTRIRSRRAASVFFDTLWTIREEFGIRSQAHAVLDQRPGSDDDDGSISSTDNRPTTDVSNITTPVMCNVVPNMELNTGEKPMNGLLEDPIGSLLMDNEGLKMDWQDAETIFRGVDSVMLDLGFQSGGLNL